MTDALPVISAAVEGDTDEAILRRLASYVGLQLGIVYGKTGKDDLDRRLRGYNHAARFAPWVVLRDLDHDAPCAPDLLRALLPNPAPLICLRIPVRSVEAWVLADKENLARHLSIHSKHIPSDPESLVRPKRTLVDVARRSRKRMIVREMVPPQGVSAEVGPAFTARVSEFVRSSWSVENAARSSSSLSGSLRALLRLKDALRQSQA